jgi:hypothetical protein
VVLACALLQFSRPGHSRASLSLVEIDNPARMKDEAESFTTSTKAGPAFGSVPCRCELLLGLHLFDG